MDENNDDFGNLMDLLKPNPQQENKDDFDNIMDLLKPSPQKEEKRENSDSKLDEIKTTLQKLQDEITQLKKEKEDVKNDGKEEDPAFDSKLTGVTDSVGKYAAQEMNKFLDETEMKAIGICICKSKIPGGSGTTMTTSCLKSFDGISEEGVAAAVEVFTNPRRIAILKVLIAQPLTATGITQKTGLVGGQLYHHLSALENAGLIVKEDDIYKADGGTYGLLINLYTVVGGMKLAKE
ncbi:MAG: ArsR family transcriptional regulator [Oscillospiraceae bacterium]|nr:ArsR family transcriptional regulator [Oscillospiraceae bacterium]